MQAIGVGMLGFGLSGSVFHAPLLEASPHFSLKAVLSSRAHALLTKYPGTQVYHDIKELCRRPDIELVIIASPSHCHYADTKIALEHAKHVVVEKPFVATSAQADELITTAKQNNLILSVFHNRRWDGDFLTVKRLVKEKILGEIVHFESHFDRFRPTVDGRWKEQNSAANGSFYDLGSHLIDQALCLFGDPDSLIGDITAQRVGAIADDYFHVILKYGKRRAILHGGSLVAAAPPRFQIHGTLGSFVKYGLDPQEAMLKNGLKPGDPQWGVDEQGAYGELTRITDGKTHHEKIKTEVGCYERFYEQLFKAIRLGEPPPVSGEDAAKVIRVIEKLKAQERQK